MYALLLSTCLWLPAPATIADPGPDELIRDAVAALLEMQEADGAWPYEGVYRVGGEIPLGYRVGGTAIVCTALLSAAPDEAAAAAIERGVDYILTALPDPLLSPSTVDAYDVRVWAHGYALEFFCRLRAAGRAAPRADEIESWIDRLVATLRTEQLSDGGWNYANRRAHAGFVTAPIVQALLLARQQGEDVPPDVLNRAATALRASRYANGAFAYSGAAGAARRRSPDSRPTSIPTTAAAPPGEGAAPTSASSTHPAAGVRGGDTTTRPAGAPRAATQRWSREDSLLIGSIARSPVCETTLLLLGDGSPDAIRRALDDFHTHWEHLETRRKKTGTHVPPFGIAPYYFYYGHRYAAQAIEFLPPGERAAARARLLATILKTRDEDGTWNDRVFRRSRNFGTAMIVLALLGERQPGATPLSPR